MWTLVNASYGVAMGQRPGVFADTGPGYPAASGESLWKRSHGVACSVVLWSVRALSLLAAVSIAQLAPPPPDWASCNPTSRSRSRTP
jgi:hypothetical protein